MKSHKHLSPSEQVGSLKLETVIYCTSSQKNVIREAKKCLSNGVWEDFQSVQTCHGLSQSRGIGKAPTQAPTTVQATVICRQVSHTDMALEPETEENQELSVYSLDKSLQNIWHIDRKKVKKTSRIKAHPCRLNTRIQAWTLGPRTQRHLSVVREVSSTARENVSKADLKHMRN